jgi:hypothetical protein
MMTPEEHLTQEMQVAHDALVGYTTRPQLCSDFEYFAELRRLTERKRQFRQQIKDWKLSHFH